MTEPKAEIERVVETSNRPVLLHVYNLVGVGFGVGVSAFDGDGWEERARRLGWSAPGRRRSRKYHRDGGRDSLGEAIAEAAGIPADEAERIATETLLEWAGRVAPEEIEAHRGLRAFLWGLAALAAILVATFVALLVVVLILVF